MNVDLGITPYIVLSGYLVLLLALGIISYLKSKQSEADYFLAGRDQGVIVSALTIMATYFSGFAILTFPGWVYEHGIGIMLLGLNLPVAAAAIYIIGNRIRRVGKKRGYITPADMLADYYGDSLLFRWTIALIGFLYVVPYVAIQIKAGGALTEGLFRNVEAINLFGYSITIYDAGATLLSIVTTLYVIIGGMRSVAWTDVLQGTLLFSGMLLSSPCGDLLMWRSE